MRERLLVDIDVHGAQLIYFACVIGQLVEELLVVNLADIKHFGAEIFRLLHLLWSARNVADCAVMAYSSVGISLRTSDSSKKARICCISSVK